MTVFWGEAVLNLNSRLVFEVIILVAGTVLAGLLAFLPGFIFRRKLLSVSAGPSSPSDDDELNAEPQLAADDTKSPEQSPELPEPLEPLVPVVSAQAEEPLELPESPRQLAAIAPEEWGARILVVENDSEMCAYLINLLRPLAEVRSINNGADALNVVYNWRPDIVITDTLVPVVDGLELCRLVKADAEISQTPVLLITGLTSREALLKGWQAGADDYLFKPFHSTELLTRVGTILRRLRERRTSQERIESLSTTLDLRMRDLSAANEEIRWLTRELQSARDGAVAANQTKSQFLSNISHEIRTPLNGLITTTELLLQSHLDEEQREFVSISRESAFSLLETVNDLLDFSSIESGKLDLDRVDFDVLSLVEGCAELLSPRARQKGLSLMTYVASDVPRKLFGDPSRIRQVLVNLIGNAIKFTDQGEVVCRATLQSTSEARCQIRFSVYDTGVGLSENARDHLFEPFSQLDASLTRRQTGTGLGLSIARRLVELMGGSINVDSAEGKGSTFSFTIPLENRVHGITAHYRRNVDQLCNLRLLVIDTMKESQKVIESYAQSWSMSCGSAPTAAEGLALMSRAHADKKPFDVVIIDFDVTDIHPFTLSRHIHNNPGLRDTKLILMTSTDEDGRGPRALKCGFAAYLKKPLKQSELFDCVASVVGDYDKLTVLHTPGEIARTDPDEPRKQPIILVAEDNLVNQKVARLQLEELGFWVHVVNNGQEAVDAVARMRYDIVLMDCAMPVMDGYSATGQIRKQDALSGVHTIIVAMTAHSMKGDREKCIAAGMDDYLCKPVAKAKLHETLLRWLDFDSEEHKDEHQSHSLNS